MNFEALSELAEAAGLQTRWQDAAGAQQSVRPEALTAILSAMGLESGSPAQIRDSLAGLQIQRDVAPAMLTTDIGGDVEWTGQGRTLAGRLTLDTGEARDVWLKTTARGVSFKAPDTPGYHRLEAGDREVVVAVAPQRGRQMRDQISSGRAWGTAVQVYSLGSRRDGFGDFADLVRFAGAMGARGAQTLAISPVHALFAADPSRYSPYAPSSRLFLNSLYGDPDRIGGEARTSGAQNHHADLIDWAVAAPAKLARLRGAYRRLIDQGGAALEALQAFRRDGGLDLERHAQFETLHAHFFGQTRARGWPDWPQAFHDPESPEVAAFVRDRSDEVAFHAFLQWLADAGLAQAQSAAKAAGMGVGLIADLAVGLDAGGSQAWSRPNDLVRGVSVGAPPDLFQPQGQDWGVAALSPGRLRASGYDAFLATLRRAMRHAGGVRIDHVMGLRRLWLTPHGASPREGAYLTYPFEDLLRLIALESHRAQAIVIGEDLGTVPPGFRETLHDRGVLGMGVLWFERAAGSEAFAPPDAWDKDAAALTTTHDLPTVAGWWSGRDIEWQARLAPAGRQADGVIAQARVTRHADRDRLWSACVAAGVGSGTQPSPEQPEAAVDAAVAYVAACACPLVIVPVEDLIGARDQPNRPGTVDEHPNWRRRLPTSAGDVLDEPDVARRIDALRKARPA